MESLGHSASLLSATKYLPIKAYNYAQPELKIIALKQPPFKGTFVDVS